MANSNPVLELLVDGTPLTLILTADNARKRLRYELFWVELELEEHEVQVPALGFVGQMTVGFFEWGNQDLRLAAVEYFVGSSDADGFIGAGFAFRPEQSPLWEIVHQTAVDSSRYMYSSANQTVAVQSGGNEVFQEAEEARNDDSGPSTEAQYVWSELLVSIGDADDVSNAQGVSFPTSVDGGSTISQPIQLFGEFSGSWDVVVDFNAPCLTLPREFYDTVRLALSTELLLRLLTFIQLAGWIGLTFNSQLGLSEYASPATALPELFFSLEYGGKQLALPLQALVLPVLNVSRSSDAALTTGVCVQRSVSILQKGTSALSSASDTVRDSAHVERLHGSIGLPVFNMIDAPIVFGSMVLDALDSVMFDGASKRTGIRSKAAGSSAQSAVPCLSPATCIGHQLYVERVNMCQGMDSTGFEANLLEIGWIRPNTHAVARRSGLLDLLLPLPGGVHEALCDRA
ncbi:hypothetical protein BBJ28_00011636 [Nothophytophthora sp. Chile5]|nr:hypothetical protein BBJ28_00011636 [Nothophytophthora sp. Chile5]